MTALLVALGGGLGAAGRFMADGAMRARWRGAFPLATFLVNVTGSLLIGLLNGAHLFHGFGSVWFVALTTGVCGGYTTFSTAAVETVRLARADEVRWAVLNAVGTLVACVMAAAVGVGIMWLAGH